MKERFMGFNRARPRLHRRSLGDGYVVLFATMLLSSCIIDKDHRCDDRQVYIEQSDLTAASCLCGPGSVPDADGVGCVQCGAHETVQNGKCACDTGYTQATDGGVCEKAAVGAECAGDSECGEPFPYCAADGDEHYCSVTDCTATSCPSGFACDHTDASSFCKKLPKGLGAMCTSDSDCAAGEAKFCDSQMTHTCILTGCASGDVKCPGFYGCCDLNSLVPGLSVCTPPSALPDGKCSFGTLVMP
jgi:hypothetical protein